MILSVAQTLHNKGQFAHKVSTVLLLNLKIHIRYASLCPETLWFSRYTPSSNGARYQGTYPLASVNATGYIISTTAVHPPHIVLEVRRTETISTLQPEAQTSCRTLARKLHRWTVYTWGSKQGPMAMSLTISTHTLMLKCTWYPRSRIRWGLSLPRGGR